MKIVKLLLCLIAVSSLTAYANRIINDDGDLSYELRGIFSRANIIVPDRDALLTMLQENFVGGINFNDEDKEKVRSQFLSAMDQPAGLINGMLNALYNAFSIQQDHCFITPVVDILVMGAGGPDVTLQRLARLKALEESGSFRAKSIVFISSPRHTMLERFRHVDAWQAMFQSYRIDGDLEFVSSYLTEKANETITHAEAFENILMPAALNDHFQGRWSVFLSDELNPLDRYQHYFETLAQEIEKTGGSRSLGALENSFLTKTEEKNVELFKILDVAKINTSTNNIQFIGSIVAGPRINSDGSLNVEEEMNSHASSASETVLDLFMRALRQFWARNKDVMAQ